MANNYLDYKTKFFQYVKQFKVNYDFDFKKIDQFVIFVCFLLLPILLSIIRYVVLIDSLNINYYLKSSVVKIDVYLSKAVIPLIALVYCLFKFWKKMIINKLIGLFLWTCIVYLFVLLTNWIANFFPTYTSSVIFIDISYVLYGFLVIFFYFYKSETLKIMWFKIKLNIKKIYWLVLIIILGIVIYYLLNLVFTLIQSTYNNQTTSNNQASLNSNYTTWYGIIYLFFSTLILAPILEELSFRMVFMSFFNNKLYSVILNTIFFAFLHIRGNNSLTQPDYLHFLSYISLGIVNGLIYFYFKNIYPCILIHFIINVFAFFGNWLF